MSSGDPWDPFADEYISVHAAQYDGTGAYQPAFFRLDTFVSLITIDGCDTGIPHFVYDGNRVSQYLADCATNAGNHGGYVRCVANLNNELRNAGFLAGEQKGVIMSCAAASSIGN